MYEMESCATCRYYKPRDGDPPPSRGWPQRGWCTRYAARRTLSDTWCRWFAQKDAKGDENQVKTYIFAFVGEKNGRKIIEDIRERVLVCEDLDLQGIKECHAMALEIQHGVPFRCVEIREANND